MAILKGNQMQIYDTVVKSQYSKQVSANKIAKLHVLKNQIKENSFFFNGAIKSIK